MAGTRLSHLLNLTKSPYQIRLGWGVLLFLALISFTSCSGWQKNRAAKRLAKLQSDTMNTPYWVGMMDDTLVPYYSTVHAFELYWQNREKPLRDEDNEGENLFGGNEGDKQGGEINKVYEYKRYLHWKEVNQHNLKENGLIMTPYDIYMQWKRNQTDSTK